MALVESIFRWIKAYRGNRRGCLDVLPILELNGTDESTGASPDDPRTSHNSYLHSSTRNYIVSFGMGVITIPGQTSSDMDRDVRSGVAYSAELQDLEAVIPRYHAF